MGPCCCICVEVAIQSGDGTRTSLPDRSLEVQVQQLEALFHFR